MYEVRRDKKMLKDPPPAIGAALATFLATLLSTGRNFLGSGKANFLQVSANIPGLAIIWIFLVEDFVLK